MASPFPPVEVLGKQESFGLFPRTAPTAITGLTGGGSTNLDGIDVANLTAGTRISFSSSAQAYSYVLIASAAGESSPAIIAPDTGGSGYRWYLESQVFSRVFVTDGTAALPTITFASEPTTGFYRYGSGQMGFSSGGTPQLVFTDFGRIFSSNLGCYIMLATAGLINIVAAGSNQNISLVPSGVGATLFGGTSSTTVRGTAIDGDLAVIKTTKYVTNIPNASATAVLTVTIPNATHRASLKVRLHGALGTGGAIGSGEAAGTVAYDIVFVRTPGVNAVATISTAYGSGMANVAGAATITVTAAMSAVAGAVGATNTFTVNVTISRGGGSSANHTCMVLAELMNVNSTGITMA